MLRRRVESLTGNDSRRPPPSFVPTPTYPHVSSYCSLPMEVRVYSPSVKVVNQAEKRPVPVFGDGDQIGGTVILDPSCSTSGRLTVKVEGAFTYPFQGQDISTGDRNSRHVFFSANHVFPASPTSSEYPRSAFRVGNMKRRPSISSLNISFSSSSSPPSTAIRSFPFTFDLPKSARLGEEIPPSFTTTSTTEPSSDRGRGSTFAVEYAIHAIWEPNDASNNPSFLDVPIHLSPDTDFQSLDGLIGAEQRDSWLEMPLRSDRPMPFRCAVTLPTSVTFSRTSSIPYFVVFTTSPRNLSLAKEIAADATISVSVLRQVSVTEQTVLPPTPPQTPSSDESESFRGSSSGGRLFKRVVKNTAPLLSRNGSRNPSTETLEQIQNKPLPRLPTHTTFNESRMLHTSMCIGFPKRPRGKGSRKDATGKTGHPTLDEHSSLPDGLHRSKILLNRDMLPCIDWAGVSVKYYLDVSVSFGQDDFRARIPIRIV